MKNSIKIFILLSLILPLVCSTGCTVNNGDIGPLYGTWVITEMEVDGQEYDSWQSADHQDTFFEFQNNILMVHWSDAYHQSSYCVATWAWTDDDQNISSGQNMTMVVDWTHSDNQFAPGTILYQAPAWLLLDSNTLTTFNVSWLSENRMVWTTTNADGQHLTYHLKKTW